MVLCNGKVGRRVVEEVQKEVQRRESGSELDFVIAFNLLGRGRGSTEKGRKVLEVVVAEEIQERTD